MRAFVLLLAGALIPAVAPAQADTAVAADSGAPKPGAAVRVTTRAGRRLEGRLDGVSAAAVRIRVHTPDGPFPVAIPRDSVARLEVNHPGGRRTLAGGLWGFAAGTAAASVLAAANCVVFCTRQQEDENNKTVAVGMLGGTVLGALLGATRRSAHWREVPADRIAVTVRPGAHGPGLGLTLRF